MNTRSLTQPKLSSSAPVQTGLLQRKCAQCNEKEKMQRLAVNQTDVSEVPAIVHEVLRSPGQPLDTNTRVLMEPRFNRDFSQVKLHTNTKAIESAKAVNALAYTVRQNIVFAAEQYQPLTLKGQRLLAHELTHVLQQSSANDNLIYRPPNSSGYEEEEDQIAATTVLKPQQIITPSFSTQAILAKQSDSDKIPPIERSYELDPNMFLKKMEGTAVREDCKEFPGGTTKCEVNEQTGLPTGKVTQEIRETNPCVRPCVVLHEGVHKRQLSSLCPKFRACYQEVEAGKRSVNDCFSMVVSGIAQRECEAYKVSIPCLKARLEKSPSCVPEDQQAYGRAMLTKGDECFGDYYCGKITSNK